MATVAFAAAAAAATEGAAAATIAAVGALATTAGALIDQALVFPALGLAPKPPDIQGQRIDDLQLSLSSEGAPKNYCVGPKNKVPGTVIWMSKVREEATSKKVGGGKNAVTATDYEYFMDMAIGVNTGKTISRITDLWVNGELIYTQTTSPNITDSSSQLFVTRVSNTYFSGYKYINGRWVAQYFTIVTMRIDSPSGGPDLSAFRTGIYTDVSGWSNAGNNGSFYTNSSGKATSGASWLILANSSCVTEAAASQTPNLSQTIPTWDKRKFRGRVLSYTSPVASSVATWSAQKTKLWAAVGSLNTTAGFYDDGKITWTSGANNGTVSYIKNSQVVYGGSFIEFELENPTANNFGLGDTFNLQAPDERGLVVYKGNQVSKDPVIEAAEGAANAKVWSGEAYFVIDDLNLKEFGNQIPISWSVLVEAESSATVGEAVDEILQRGGLAASKIDISALTDALKGYYYSGPRPTLEALNPLIIAFDLVAQERNGKLVFFKRADAEEITVSADHLTAHDEGSEPPPKPVLITRLNAKDLPADVMVEFIDEDSVDENGDPSYEKGVVPAGRNIAAVNQEIIRSTQVRVTMSRDDAKKVGHRALWTLAANQRRVAFQLPPSYIHVLENDRVVIPTSSGDRKVLVQQLQRGHNFLLIGEGVVEEDQTLTW